jgi:hypothetical protein
LGIGIRNIFGECLEEKKCGEVFVSNFFFLNAEILFLKFGLRDAIPTKLDDSKMCKERISKRDFIHHHPSLD